MNAVAYLRVSSKEQAEEGYSLEAQRLACTQYAKEKGLALVRTFEDRGESGTSLDRPGFQEMLECLESGTSVIVHKLDRFGRSLDDYVAVRADLRRRGVKILSVSENLDDSVSGLLVENVLASISDWYSRNLSSETKKGKLQKAKEGWYPSVAPLGYLNQDGIIVPDPERAPLIREAFEMYGTGWFTLKQLQKELAIRGLKGKGGQPLALSRLASIMNNPFYVGRFIWNGVEYQGKHVPLISEETWNKVRAYATSNTRGRIKQAKHDHYLRTVLFCSCGRRMGFQLSKFKFPYFYCLSRICGAPYVPVADVEEQVEALYQDVQIPDDVRRALEDQLEYEIGERTAHRRRMEKQLSRRLEKLEKQRDKLMEAYFADAIPTALLKREQNRITEEEALLKTELELLDRKLAESHELVAIALSLVENCHESYRNASPAVRQKWNEAVFQRVTIKERKVARVSYQEPFKTFLSSLSSGTTFAPSRRRTGIEPACRLSPAHRF